MGGKTGVVGLVGLSIVGGGGGVMGCEAGAIGLELAAMGVRDALLSLKGTNMPYSPSKRESLSGFFRARPSFIGLIASINLTKEVLVTARREGI